MSYNEPPNYGAPPPPPGGYGGGGDQGGYGGGGSYGAPGPGGFGAQPPKQSVMAIIALVSGILGLVTFCCCYGILGIPGIILGFLGMKEVKESNGAKTGHGLALAGLITGALAVVLGIIWAILVFATGTFEGDYYNDF